MQNPSPPTMAVTVPPAEWLLSVGTWCELLGGRIADSTSIEWRMRLASSIGAAMGPVPRFANGVPMPRCSGWDLFSLSALDVAAWLQHLGYVVRHEVQAEAENPEPVAAEEVAMVTAPTSLRALDIACAFADLHWTQNSWYRELTNTPIPRWLEPAMTFKGNRREGLPTLWNPLLLASALVLSAKVSVESLNHRFDTVPSLQPWRAAWKAYVEDVIGILRDE